MGSLDMAEDLGQQLPATRNLHECLSRAEELAARRKHTVVGLDHLLMALAEDPDALGVLLACRVEVEAMCADLLRKLGPEARALSPNAVPPTQDITVQNLMAHASAAAQKSARTEVDGANVITAIISGEGGLITHKILARHGLTFDDAMKNLTGKSNADAKSTEAADKAGDKSADDQPAKSSSQDNNPPSKGPAPTLKIALRHPPEAAARNQGAAADNKKPAAANARQASPQKRPATKEDQATQQATQDGASTGLIDTDDLLAADDPRYNPLEDGIIQAEAPNSDRRPPPPADQHGQETQQPGKKPHAFPGKFPGQVKINQVKKSQQRPGFGRRPAPPSMRPDGEKPQSALPDASDESPASTPRSKVASGAQEPPEGAASKARSPLPGAKPARPPSPVETDDSRDPATLRSMAPEKAAPPPHARNQTAPETTHQQPPEDRSPAGSAMPPPHPDQSPLPQKAFDETAFVPPPPQNLPPADATPAPPNPLRDDQSVKAQPPQWNPADISSQASATQRGLPPHQQAASHQPLPPNAQLHGQIPTQIPTQIQSQIPGQIPGQFPSHQMPPPAQPQGHPAPPQNQPPAGPPPEGPPQGYSPLPQDNTARMDDIANSIRRSQAQMEQHADQDHVVENIPKVMRVGKVHYVEVRVARFTNAELDLDSDNYGLRSKAEKKQITKAITVRLTGPDGLFLIDSATASTQWSELHGATGNDADFAVWRWRVLPRRPGQSKLRLDITVRAAGQNAVSAEIPVQPSKSFEVKITRNYASLLKRLVIWGTIFALGFGIDRYGPTVVEGAKSKVQTLLTGAEDD